MQPIKVLHFIWSANFGGIEKVVIDLCKSQIAAGQPSPTLLIGVRKGSFLEHVDQAGIPHVFAGFKSGSDFNLRLYNTIKQLMNGYDILHLHTFNPLIALAAISSGKPIVYTIHGNFNFGRKMRWNDRINQFLRKYFFNRHVNHVTFNSEFTKSMARQRYGLKKSKWSIVYNGIPLKASNQSNFISDPEHLNRLTNKFVVGTTSRFAGFKRIDRLITAFSVFARKKDDVLLLLVGDGILRKQLESQVTASEIQHKTLFAGFRQNVTAYQAAMNVCVFPSQNEPFGLVAVETLALGKPTLVFNDAGGMLEILRPEFESDIVSDIPALVERLESLYANRFSDSTAEIVKRKNVASRYDINQMATAMFDVYKSVLEK